MGDDRAQIRAMASRIGKRRSAIELSVRVVSVIKTSDAKYVRLLYSSTIIKKPRCWSARMKKANLLRKTQIDHLRRLRSAKQVPIVRRLVDEARMLVIPALEVLLPAVVAADVSCERGRVLCVRRCGVVG